MRWEAEGREEQGPISRAIDSFVQWLEKDRLPLYGKFLYVIAVALIRDVSEYYLLDHEFVVAPHPWIFSIGHHVAFYVVVFLGLAVLLTAFSGRGARRSSNFICSFWWIIIIPPYMDHFIFGLATNYSYFSPTDFLNALIHFSGEVFNMGQATEVCIVLFAVFAYAVWSEREYLETIYGRGIVILKTGFLVFFTFFSMFIMATPGAFIPVGSTHGIPDFPAFDLTKYYQYHLFLIAWYLVLGLLLLVALVYLIRKGKSFRILRSFRPPQTAFFAAIVAAGLVLGWKSDGGLELITSILERPYWVNISFALISIISAVLAWIVSVMWNDLSDRGTDAPTTRRFLACGEVEPSTYGQASYVVASVALILSFLLSYQQLLVMIVILALAYVYSFKPIRFKEHILSPMLIGAGTFFAFMYGVITPYSEVMRYTESGAYLPHLTGEVLIPAITPEAFVIGFFMFVGLVVGSMITDVDGYQEDKRAGVKTIYTFIGLEKGVKVVSILILISSLTPLALFREWFDFVVFPVLGIVAAARFHREGSSQPVIIIAFIGLVYAALRFIGLL